MLKKIHLLLLSVFVFVLSGCSVTTLRCGIHDDGSYVDMTNVPQDISAQVRYYADLCGFQFDGDSDGS